MNGEPTDDEDEPKPEPATMKATIAALNNLPILARLEFVANLLFDHGGSRESSPRDWHVVTATEVLDGVISVLKTQPQAAQLRRPEP